MALIPTDIGRNVGLMEDTAKENFNSTPFIHAQIMEETPPSRLRLKASICIEYLHMSKNTKNLAKQIRELSEIKSGEL